MATQRWESCIYSAEEERDFLKNFLGPTLEKAGMEDKKIIVWDHNRDLLFERANVILSDPEANKYVWGTGFHWYEDWKDGKPMFENVGKVNQAYPEKKLIFTEGCNEGFDPNDSVTPNCERYGKAMINDFNNGMVAWTDWNILLDETGGPNQMATCALLPFMVTRKRESSFLRTLIITLDIFLNSSGPELKDLARDQLRIISWPPHLRMKMEA